MAALVDVMAAVGVMAIMDGIAILLIINVFDSGQRPPHQASAAIWLVILAGITLFLVAVFIKGFGRLRGAKKPQGYVER